MQVETRLRMQNLVRLQTRASVGVAIDRDVMDIFEDRASGRNQRCVTLCCPDEDLIVLVHVHGMITDVAS